MLDDLFKPYECSINRIDSNKALYKSYRLKCQSIKLDNILNWNSTTTLEMALKPKINKFFSILSNGVIFNEEEIYNEHTILDFIEYYYLRLTPDAKLDAILEYISNLTSFDGESVRLKIPKPINIAQQYFNNGREWRFYIDNAISQGYVSKKDIIPLNDDKYTEHALTVAGLTRLIKVSEGKSSRYCFIAMAFLDDMFLVLEEAIKPALRTFLFEPLIVSEQHIDSDKTINDAILAGIKKSRFTIADFTHHRGGVYFEAGYALGRGQNVIYTCRQDHMQDAHFDIRNYQHIVWTDSSNFKKQLINKIEAFILD